MRRVGFGNYAAAFAPFAIALLRDPVFSNAKASSGLDWQKCPRRGWWDTVRAINAARTA